jgi:hypothetical protein
LTAGKLALDFDEILPDVRIQPAYSTKTGVPGVVAGRP